MADSRWAQLSFASFDPGGGQSGGWGVKETAGGLSEAESKAIQQYLVKAFALTEQPPRYATPEMIEALPRRFVYGRVGDGAAAYWHAALAGFDGSGRPGNVFSHVLLDRDPRAAQPPLRPIDSWRSPAWLVPYGAQQVLEAHLPTEPPVGGGPLDRSAVADFLLDPAAFRRGGQLAVLLDAVAAALAGGPAVVLATATPDDAARWIAAVSRFAAPQTCRLLPFSVYERARGVDAAIKRGLRLIGISHGDTAELTSSSLPIVLVDDRETPSIGSPGGQHRIGGAAVDVTPWSLLAEVAQLDAEQAFSRIDEIAAEFPGEPLHPAWPLALIAALEPEDFADVAEPASTVLRDHSPLGLRDHARYWPAASVVMQRLLGETAEDARVELAAASGESAGLMRMLATASFLSRAFVDDAWLRSPQRSEIPEFGQLAASDRGRLLEEARSAIQRSFGALESQPGDPAAACGALRLAVLVDVAALGNPESDELLLGQLIGAACEVFNPENPPEAAQRVIDAIGPLTGPFLARRLRPAFEAVRFMADRPPGQRLAPAVVGWVFADDPALSSVDAAVTEQALPKLVVERIVQGFSAGDERIRPLLPAALVTMCRAAQFDSRNGIHMRMARKADFSVAEAIELEQHVPGLVGDRRLFDLMLTAPAEAGVLRLASQLSVAPQWADSLVGHLAVLIGECERVARGGFTAAAVDAIVREAGLLSSYLGADYSRVAGPVLAAAFVAALHPAPAWAAVRPPDAGAFVASQAARVTPEEFRAQAASIVAARLIEPNDLKVLVDWAVLGTPKLHVRGLPAVATAAPADGVSYKKDRQMDTRFVLMLVEEVLAAGVFDENEVTQALRYALEPHTNPYDRRSGRAKELKAVAQDLEKRFSAAIPASRGGLRAVIDSIGSRVRGKDDEEEKG